MNRRTLSIAAGSLLAAAAAVTAGTPAALAAAPGVTVRVEGLSSTVMPARTVQLGAGSVTRGGAPAGKCSDASAQGALAAATRGNWQGKWESNYGDYFDTGILGTTESGSKDYWELFVNNTAAKSGFCQTSVKSGDQLLIAAVPSKGKPLAPIAIKVAGKPAAGKPFAAEVLGYNAKGVGKPLAGASVKVGSTTLQSGADGKVSAIAPHGRSLTISAAKRGYIRDEQTVVLGS